MPALTIEPRYLRAILRAHGDRLTVNRAGLTLDEHGDACGMLVAGELDVTYLVTRDWIDEYAVTPNEAVNAMAFALGDHCVGMRDGVVVKVKVGKPN